MLQPLRILILTLMFGVGILTLESVAETPPIDPEATRLLKDMSDYLGGQKSFSVQTQNTLEDLFAAGHRVDLDVSANVVVSRPNKLRADRKGDLVDHVFYYNGRELSLYSPVSNAYATMEAPDTFYGLFQFLYEKVGLGLPISDLVHQDSYPLLIQDVTLAKIVGKTVIGGVKATHLLFSRPGVDFQIWIAEKGAPLPLKYVVTDTSGADRLSISSRMTNWDVQTVVDESQFTFVPPEKAEAINFILQ